MINQARTWMWAAGLGAAAMFLLDPDRGRRRRAIARDKLVHAARKTRDAAGTVSRDASHRARGVAAHLRGRFAGDEASDDVVAARVRSALGRLVGHPGSIEVVVDDGHVTLHGPVLAREVSRLLRRIERVPGVRSVENRLDVHETPGDVPGLQGAAAAEGARGAFMQAAWSPTARLAAGTAGIGLIATGLRRHGVTGTSSLLAGTGLLMRSAANRPLAQLAGLKGMQAVRLEKTIQVAAPIEEVFRLWQHYEYFPRFMSHVREVVDLGDGHSRWTVDGPGGVPVTWEAQVTELVPDHLIAWKSVPGSAVSQEGSVRFDPAATGTTRVTLRLSYSPPVGVAGHGVATLFGASPRRQIDEDLLRMKTLVEEGVPAHDADAGIGGGMPPVGPA
ncbi:MAG TPA: SRPBCC family protein [Methylomirabilota bacterium]